MRVYADSSALVKRAIQEQHSEALVSFFRRAIDSGDELMSSLVAEIEVGRAIRSRHDEGDIGMWQPMIDQSLSGVEVIELSEEVVDLASRIGVGSLRSLDAIHIASAFSMRCDVFVTYDDLQARYSSELGMLAVSPE